MSISLMEKSDFIEKYNGKDHQVLDRMYAVFHKIQHQKALLLLDLKEPEPGDDEDSVRELMNHFEHYRALEFVDAAIREILTGEDMNERIMSVKPNMKRFLGLFNGFKHEMSNKLN